MSQQQLLLASSSLPVPRIFERVPVVPSSTFNEALTLLLTSFKSPPPNRSDLTSFVPTSNDLKLLTKFIELQFQEIKANIQKNVPSAASALSDDEIKALFTYTLEQPYPVYRWLNAWLMTPQRETDFKEAIGPFFILLYRAMEKLPIVTVRAARSIKVNNIPALNDTYKNYVTRCAPGERLSFWGFASFSPSDTIVNSSAFLGQPNEEAIIYTCPELEGVDITPFKHSSMRNESEIVPFCPVVFEVVTATMVGKKLSIVVTQTNHHETVAYVEPKIPHPHRIIPTVQLVASLQQELKQEKEEHQKTKNELVKLSKKEPHEEDSTAFSRVIIPSNLANGSLAQKIIHVKREFKESAQFKEAWICDSLRHLAYDLEQLHKQQPQQGTISHGAIRPENVLLYGKSDRVLLTKSNNEKEGNISRDDPWRAPESTLSTASDIWSLGVVAVSLALVSTINFSSPALKNPDANNQELFLNHDAWTDNRLYYVVFDSIKARGYEPRTAEIICSLLRKNPKDRPTPHVLSQVLTDHVETMWPKGRF